MSKLNNFRANAINRSKSAQIKGGTNFCEWYINQRGGKKIAQGQISKAMVLDSILTTDGEDAAMAAGGAEFLAKHS